VAELIRRRFAVISAEISKRFRCYLATVGVEKAIVSAAPVGFVAVFLGINSK
jgi:hypothetical protein